MSAVGVLYVSLKMLATNRQKKILSFFGIQYSSNITVGAAGWEIGDIFDDENKREKWRKYLYLTSDFDTNSPLLKAFDALELDTVEVPEGWSSSAAIQNFQEELVASAMSDGSPFDEPAPEVVVQGCSFLFTGKFSFGTRKKCQEAVEVAGGIPSKLKAPTRDLDYLVIGTEGSPSWKKGSYGNKIEAAILNRRQHGNPAIVSEQEWKKALNRD